MEGQTILKGEIIMRRLFIFVLIFALLFITACSKKDNTPTPGNSQNVEETATQAETAGDNDNTPVETQGDNDKTPAETEKDETPDETEEDDLVVNEYKPFVIAFMDQEGMFSQAQVIGGSKDGKWYDVNSFEIKGEYTSPEDFADVPVVDNYVELDLVKGGETYMFYNEFGYQVKSKGEKPTLYISPETGEKTLTIDIEAFETDGNFVVGINGGWKASPESPVLLAEDGSVSVDIDGDGDNDAISLTDNGLKMDAFGNEVQELALNISKGNEEIFVCNILYDGISTIEYKVLVLDLDGNGSMEVMVVEYGISTTVRVFNVGEDIADLVLISHIGE